MKKNIKIIYLLELLILILCITLILLFKYIDIELITIITLLIIFIISLKKLNLKKDNNINKQNAIGVITTVILIILIITYLLGLITGFNKGFKLNTINNIFNIFLRVITISVLNEFIRYIIFKNTYNNNKPIIIFTILSIILNIILKTNINSLNDTEQIFIYICNVVIITISEELLLSYMTYKIGLIPSIYYKLLTRTYTYILPIIPSLGNYIHSVIFVLMPYIIFLILNNNKLIFSKDLKKTKQVNTKLITIPIIITLVIMTSLISGIFRYKMIAIKSNSMQPVFRRGDAIIYKKVNIKDLKIGDTITFKYENMIIAHRIINIKYKNNKYYFETKGDNNEAKDAFITKEEDVLGKVKYVIKYIGYPTIFVQEQFRKD